MLDTNMLHQQLIASRKLAGLLLIGDTGNDFDLAERN
jgi:hypothetical protein